MGGGLAPDAHSGGTTDWGAGVSGVPCAAPECCAFQISTEGTTRWWVPNDIFRNAWVDVAAALRRFYERLENAGSISMPRHTIRVITTATYVSIKPLIHVDR